MPRRRKSVMTTIKNNDNSRPKFHLKKKQKRRFKKKPITIEKQSECQQKGKKLKKSDILTENLKKVSAEDQNEMKRICDKIGIEMNLGVKLYGFKGYLAVYKCILDLM